MEKTVLACTTDLVGNIIDQEITIDDDGNWDFVEHRMYFDPSISVDQERADTIMNVYCNALGYGNWKTFVRDYSMKNGYGIPLSRPVFTKIFQEIHRMRKPEGYQPEKWNETDHLYFLDKSRSLLTGARHLALMPIFLCAYFGVDFIMSMSYDNEYFTFGDSYYKLEVRFMETKYHYHSSKLYKFIENALKVNSEGKLVILGISYNQMNN